MTRRPLTRSQEDSAARARGFTDADHFLRLASVNFGSWVWREYQAIFMGRIQPLPPGGIPQEKE